MKFAVFYLFTFVCLQATLQQQLGQEYKQHQQQQQQQQAPQNPAKVEQAQQHPQGAALPPNASGAINYSEELCRKVFDSRSSKAGRFDASQLFAPVNSNGNGNSNSNSNSVAAGSSLPVRAQCRYEFHASLPGERVQIKFLDFNIPTEQKNSSECRHSDALQLLRQVRGKYEVTELICGAFLPKPLMSTGPDMVLQFMGKLAANPNAKATAKAKATAGFYGFKAEYKFVTDFGITTGQQLDDNCTFAYNSTERKSGWFGSPNFPGLYPHNMVCNYYFYGQHEEIVTIRFTYFDVEGIDTCDHSTASDYVEFSNFMSTDRKYSKFCGKRDKFELHSDGKFFRISFYSNDRFDKSGFRALYDFRNKYAQLENTTAMESYKSNEPVHGPRRSSTPYRLLITMFICSVLCK